MRRHKNGHPADNLSLEVINLAENFQAKAVASTSAQAQRLRRLEDRIADTVGCVLSHYSCAHSKIIESNRANVSTGSILQR